MDNDAGSIFNTIGKSLLLRRTKDQIKSENGGDADVPDIPEKTIEQVFIDLSDEEKRVYEHLFDFARCRFILYYFHYLGYPYKK